MSYAHVGVRLPRHNYVQSLTEGRNGRASYVHVGVRLPGLT